MNARERFLAILVEGRAVRPPRLEREIRDEVLALWVEQGYPADADPRAHFGLDRLQTGGLDGPPGIHFWARPPLEHTLRGPADVPRWRASFQLGGRLSPTWADEVAACEDRTWPLGLSVFRGLFLNFGVGDGQSLREHLYFLEDHPAAAEEALAWLTEYTLVLTARALEDLAVDYLMLHEPIASFHGPVIGPRTFDRYLAPLYRQVVDLGRAAGVPLFCWETYGQVEPLIPAVLDCGVNLLWLGHASGAGTDYRRLRERLPVDVGLIGGIDDGALRQGPAAIRAEVAAKLPPLLAGGRWLPMLDDRVREDVPYEAFAVYDDALTEALSGLD